MRETATNKYLEAIDQQFSDGVQLYFAKAGYKVVERKKLMSILKELELQFSGITEPETAVKVGKLANANFIIFGSGQVNYTGQSPFVRACTMKMVHVETGATVMVSNWTGSGVHLGDVIHKIGSEIHIELQRLGRMELH